MKRYLSAFSVTLFLYGVVVVCFIHFFQVENKPLKLNEEKVMALNHISLIQQKEVIQQPKPIKNKDKRSRKKVETLKEITTISQNVKKKIAPKKEIKPKNVAGPEPIKKHIEQIKQIQKPQPKLVKTAIKRDYKKEFINEHLKQIVRLIQENMYYPKRARRFNIQGEVLIEFTLTKEGLTKDYKTLQGHKLLRKSTIKAIEKASIKFPKVKKDLRLVVPVVYRLT